MNPKYQIFISSTYEDLKQEREQVLKSILRLGHIPIGMEMFNAANETQWQMIKRRIEESDYYIVIIAQRYGSVEEESGLGYTEKEYDYANSIGVPILGFVLSKDASWPISKRDDEQRKQECLKRFVEKVQSKMRSSWTNKDDLATGVTLALNEAITAFPRTGWIRANQAVNPETINEMTRLSKENAELRVENSRLLTSTPVFKPEFSVRFWVSWEIWSTERNGQIEQSGGYRLYAELKNTGNEFAEVVRALVYIPRDILIDPAPEGHYTDTNRPYEMAIKYRLIYLKDGSHLRDSTDPFLPGVNRYGRVDVSIGAVEERSEAILAYTIHPDRGYSQSGEIALTDIPVENPRPVNTGE